MSDFFGDDFTADLKKFFLKSLLDELEQIASAADEDTWEIFRDEALVKCPDFISDSKANEFVNFSSWMEKFVKHIASAKNFTEFSAAIDRAFSYTENLHETLDDSIELTNKYSLGNLSIQKNLYLHCEVSEQNFLIPVNFVLEVLGNISVTPFPMKKNGFSGMVPYRGDATPVICLQDHGLPDQDNSGNICYVVCEHEGEKLALAVHKADRLLEISSEDLQESPKSGGVINVPFLTHFVIHENKNMMLFALEKMVSA